MKVFQFDPKTGRRGELIETRGLINWTGFSVRYAVEEGLIEPIPFKQPKDNASTEWMAHVDAGREWNANMGGSLLRDEWICFCMGKDNHTGVWSWIILPPQSAIVNTAKGQRLEDEDAASAAKKQGAA